jgi:hypothetical protein
LAVRKWGFGGIFEGREVVVEDSLGLCNEGGEGPSVRSLRAADQEHALTARIEGEKDPPLPPAMSRAEFLQIGVARPVNDVGVRPTKRWPDSAKHLDVMRNRRLDIERKGRPPPLEGGGGEN